MKIISDYKYTNIELTCTCSAFPEQYDAFVRDRLVGYLRLRHGHFTVRYPNFEGEIIYEVHSLGGGIFNDSEREFYLDTAKKAIWKKDHENNSFFK